MDYDYKKHYGYIIALFSDGTNEEIDRRTSLSRDEAEEYRNRYYEKHGRIRRITEIIVCDDHYSLIKRFTFSD